MVGHDVGHVGPMQLDLLGGPAVPAALTPAYERPSNRLADAMPTSLPTFDAPAAPPAGVSVTRPIEDLAPGATTNGNGATYP